MKYLTKMQLNIYQSTRIIQLYYKNNLQFVRNRIEKLRGLALNEDISISSRGIRNLIKKWHNHSKLVNLQSKARGLSQVKATAQQLRLIEKNLRRNKNLTAPQIKNNLNTAISSRTIQRYI